MKKRAKKPMKLHKWKDIRRAKPPAKEDIMAGMIDEIERAVNVYATCVEKVEQLMRQNVRTLHDVIVAEVISRLAVESKYTVAENVEYAFEYADAVVAKKAKLAKANGTEWRGSYGTNLEPGVMASHLADTLEGR